MHIDAAAPPAAWFPVSAAGLAMPTTGSVAGGLRHG